LDNQPISSFHLGQYFQVDGKQLQQQYKEHISDYHQWDQTRYAGQWVLLEQNLSPHLSTILNFLINRATNSSAESFNAMDKAFRAIQGGVRDVTFFLCTCSKIYLIKSIA